MKIFYSADAKGFFRDDMHSTMPSDAIQISARRHAQLLDAQGKGASIVADANGRPQIHMPAPTVDQLRAHMVGRIKREAARRIDAVAPPWRQINDQRLPSPDGEARFARIDAIRRASDAIEAEIAVLPAAQLSIADIHNHVAWPE